MDVQHKDNGEKGIFNVMVDGKTEAEMTYALWAYAEKETGVSFSTRLHT